MMVGTPLAKQQPRQEDAKHPNVLQRQASSPERSVWVGASAGSGKTKVLTDRMLRLLLPDAKGLPGTKPHKILALTFTKAGASEMALRIAKNLSEWAVMPLEGKNGLEENLDGLLGQKPTPEQLEAARKIFASVVDTPGGLKIMTIHSFCQSVLSRFPLEADLRPNFTALEEAQAQILLKNALNAVIQQAQIDKGSPLAEAIYNLAQMNNEDQFYSLLQNIISEKRQMNKILEKNFGVDGLYTNLCQDLNIPAGIFKENILQEACDNKNFDEKALWDACKILIESSKVTDKDRGHKIQKWLELSINEKANHYPDYKLSYLTTENKPRKSLATAGIHKKHPDVVEDLNQEAARVISLENNLKSIEIATLTRDLFRMGAAILEAYEAIKSDKNALDFDDLILRTLDLLQGNTAGLNGLSVAPWVRFKMDQGIDHILVDEAQDTNPEQWEIIQSLCDDFFDGSQDDEIKRSIFIVGDEKQSIFSFQRASPEKFHEMREWFAQKIKNTDDELEKIDFITSFRSVPAVLDVVDAVFANEDVRKGLSLVPLEHKAHRYTQAGLVELWPLFESPKKQEYDPWAPPIDIIESTSGAAQMASHVGETVARWIKNKEILESYDRPIQAGDIMILVRSRTAFIDQLVRALKTRDIPVSGVDRMILNDQLVVQDLCALAQFALLPDDDLTLATILKSPFIGWNEEQLFDIAYKRQSSLWSVLKEKSSDKAVILWLSQMIERGGKDRPYDFFTQILQESCPADDKSGLRAIKKRLGEECLDPLNEFLNASLKYETQDIPSLQNFIQSQLYNNSQIKRQMEETSNAVRIMTVHGAKGLQAPIVFLPDTTRTSSSDKAEKILWPDRSEAEYPYYCAQSKDLPAHCDAAMQVLKERNHEEYRRLLYVALTRAESRLYIGGYKATKPIIEESWYRYIEQGFKNLDAVEQMNFAGDQSLLRYSNPATDKPDREEEIGEADIKAIETPSWLFKPMPHEPFPPRPLVPSRPSEADHPHLSPLKSTQQDRFKRGNITHKLLQIVPDLDDDQRQLAAEKFVSQPAHQLSKSVQQNIVKEVMDILNHPDFAEIFGEDSIAEAPVSGLIQGKTLISGQIDRLLITDKEILIIDYKSNRPPPHDVKDVPIIYKNQMQSYANIMREIYPGRAIKCALIWTDGCRLMEIAVR